jgi:hypothetical protein
MQLSSRRIFLHALSLIGWGTICVSSASAQLPFFSGAEGYGGSFSGNAPAGGWFSNATVYHVTNLNDSGPGSLRGAFVENSSNKIIVFDVAGTINLTTDNLDIKNLSNYYIAGQTAPGPVTVYNDMAQLTHSSGKENRNVILRYMSFRKGTGDNSDAITFAGAGLGTNLILDHVSASWSEDEILSVANNNTNVTVQYSLIHDALVNNHAYGSLIRPRIDSNVTFHHNLYANNASRQARFGTYNAETLTADFRNNVVYNWRDRASYAGGSSEAEQEFVDVNFVGNYFIAGPGTVSNTTKSFIVDKNVDVRAYQSGNFVDSDKQPNPGGQPNGADTGWNQFALNTPVTDQTLEPMGTPFDTPNVTTQSANDAYWQLVDHVGNWWWNRDAIDSRVINNVLTNTAPPIGAAAPPAAELNGLLSAPLVTHPAGWDSDGDGMPDQWEVAHGLNPNSLPASPDWNLDFDNDGYINLIEYINERGEFPAPAPIVFNGATNNRYAQITNWNTNDGITAGSNWQPSKYDGAQISTGTVLVDSVGQHAGILQLAANTGDSATLNVTAGWLDVQSVLQVGVGGTATVNHSGGALYAQALAVGGADGSPDVYNLSGSGVLATGSGGMLINPTGRVNITNSAVLDAGGDVAIDGGKLNVGAQGAFKLSGGMMLMVQNFGEVIFDGEFTAPADTFYDLSSSELYTAGNLDLGSAGSVAVMLTDGYLNSDGSITIGPGGVVMGRGNVDGPNDPLRPTLIEGAVIGDSPAERINMNGYVAGNGTLENVRIYGTHAPGMSAAAVAVGDVSYGHTGVLEIELGGTTPGTEHDQVNSHSKLELDGTLAVTLINDFMPSLGDTFEILTAIDEISGVFATELLPMLTGNLTWDVVYDTNVLSLAVVAVGPEGDYNGDGVVDAADYIVWRTSSGSPDGYNTWRANFGAVLPGSVAAANSHGSQAVPEPNACLLLACGSLCVVIARRCGHAS